MLFLQLGIVHPFGLHPKSCGKSHYTVYLNYDDQDQYSQDFGHILDNQCAPHEMYVHANE